MLKYFFLLLLILVLTKFFLLKENLNNNGPSFISGCPKNQTLCEYNTTKSGYVCCPEMHTCKSRTEKNKICLHWNRKSCIPNLNEKCSKTKCKKNNPKYINLPNCKFVKKKKVEDKYDSYTYDNNSKQCCPDYPCGRYLDKNTNNECSDDDLKKDYQLKKEMIINRIKELLSIKNNIPNVKPETITIEESKIDEEIKTEEEIISEIDSEINYLQEELENTVYDERYVYVENKKNIKNNKKEDKNNILKYVYISLAVILVLILLFALYSFLNKQNSKSLNPNPYPNNPNPM